MPTSRKAAIAAALALVVVVIVAVTAFGGDTPPADDTAGSSNGNTGGGDGMAMCIEGVPDCNDTVVIPGGDDPVVDDGDDRIAEPGEPQVVEPNPDAVDLRARPFDVATPSADGTSITIDFWSGVEPCAVLGRVDVDYGPNAVTITLLEGHLDLGDAVCIEIAVLKQTVVQLDEPLGNRKIADGAA